MGRELYLRLVPFIHQLLFWVFLRPFSPLQTQQGHEGLLSGPHLCLHRPLVQMVVAQQMQHRVGNQIGALPPLGVTVHPGLRRRPLQHDGMSALGNGPRPERPARETIA